MLRTIGFLLLCLGVSVPVNARITCCAVDGKRVCGDPPPPQCLNKPKTEFTSSGVAKEVEAPLTSEQIAEREALAARKAEEEKKAVEQARRDRALMESYSSEADIDLALARAISEIEKSSVEAQNRLDAAQKKQKKLAQELEFFQKKTVPAQLQAQIKDTEGEIAAQQKALQEKDDRIAAAKVRFEADKARYRQISSKRGAK